MKPQERRMTERARVETPTLAPRGRLLPASQAAVRIGIGYDALMSVIKAGKIAVMRHDSGRLMGIYENDLDEWVAAHRTPAADVQHEPSRVERRDVRSINGGTRSASGSGVRRGLIGRLLRKV